MNGVWGKIFPQFVPEFPGFEKEETFEEVGKEILKLVRIPAAPAEIQTKHSLNTGPTC
jgi:hypothetical protein